MGSVKVRDQIFVVVVQIGRFVLIFGRSYLSVCDGGEIEIASNQSALGAQSIQDSFGVSRPAERSVDVDSVRSDPKPFDYFPIHYGDVSELHQSAIFFPS